MALPWPRHRADRSAPHRLLFYRKYSFLMINTSGRCSFPHKEKNPTGLGGKTELPLQPCTCYVMAGSSTASLIPRILRVEAG